MPARPIVLYPDTRLKTACEPATDIAAACVILDDLLATMDSCPPRTVGIAAPQIAELVRVAVVDTSRNPKYSEGSGLLKLINPVIIAHEGEQIFREGCLSIPEFTANISRHMRVTVRAIGIDGEPFEVSSEGFEAVVLQHEIDHLDGILFLDRVRNHNSDLFRRKGAAKPVSA